MATEKPVDRWLAALGIAVGIMLFLIPKTPLSVILALTAMFALLIHPLWNFWWVEKSIVRRMLGGLALVVGLVLLGAFSWPPGVTVNPKSVVFDGSMEHENRAFVIRNNKKESDVYSVQLKLRMSDGSFFDDFSFVIPVGSRKPIIDGSEIADIPAARCLDSKGRPLAIFWIYRMQPDSTREISVTHRTKSAATIDAKISFTNIPQPRMDDATKGQQDIHIDEKVTCNGLLSFWLDPTRPPRSIDVSGNIKKPR